MGLDISVLFVEVRPGAQYEVKLSFSPQPVTLYLYDPLLEFDSSVFKTLELLY